MLTPYRSIHPCMIYLALKKLPERLGNIHCVRERFSGNISSDDTSLINTNICVGVWAREKYNIKCVDDVFRVSPAAGRDLVNFTCTGGEELSLLYYVYGYFENLLRSCKFTVGVSRARRTRIGPPTLTSGSHRQRTVLHRVVMMIIYNSVERLR